MCEHEHGLWRRLDACYRRCTGLAPPALSSSYSSPLALPCMLSCSSLVPTPQAHYHSEHVMAASTLSLFLLLSCLLLPFYVPTFALCVCVCVCVCVHARARVCVTVCWHVLPCGMLRTRCCVLGVRAVVHVWVRGQTEQATFKLRIRDQYGNHAQLTALSCRALSCAPPPYSRPRRRTLHVRLT